MADDKEFENWDNYDVPRLDSDGIEKLARELVTQQIFISWEPYVVKQSFLIVLLAGIPKNAGAVYEYYSAAGDRSINGLPLFFSCRFVHVDDMPLMLRRAREMAVALGLMTQEEFNHFYTDKEEETTND